MRSLRGRLGLLVGLGLSAVTALAVLGVLFERWQEEQSSLRDDVEIAAFRLSETTDASSVSVDLPAGSNGYAVIFDAEAIMLSSSRELPDALIDLLIDNVWSVTTSADEGFTVEFDEPDGTMTVAGVGCVDPDVCDTVAVGVSEEPFASFLSRRVGWVLGAALAAGILGFGLARWLVGRSLRPVEAMRSELDQITETDLDRRVPVPGSGDELQRLGISMNDTLGRLEDAVSANERFVGDAAHELRSPITGVRAALEVERAKTPSGLIDDSIVELDRASRLVDDLLILARRQGGRSKTESVDLDDVARSAVHILRSRRPDLDVQTNLTPIRVRGNPDELQRVITNLLDNAAHYGSGKVALSTSQNAAGDGLVRVEDDGPGIHPADRQLVFERFARLDDSRARATGGSGLGLAIARELVEDHRGSITVSEASIGGAAFEVVIPAE